MANSGRPPFPFPRCWWVTDRLLAGPVFFIGSNLKVRANIDALQAVGITSIVSLVGMDEFYMDQGRAQEIAWDIAPRFSWHGFALPDGAAPNETTMKIILSWIDVGLMENGMVYVHCAGGCGRTGTVIGCWLARHEIVQGEAVVDHLGQLRLAANLSARCPETLSQCKLVTSWRKNE